MASIMIHEDTDPESCAMVRLPDGFHYTHSSFNVRDGAELRLAELAFPTFDEET